MGSHLGETISGKIGMLWIMGRFNEWNGIVDRSTCASKLASTMKAQPRTCPPRVLGDEEDRENLIFYGCGSIAARHVWTFQQLELMNRNVDLDGCTKNEAERKHGLPEPRPLIHYKLVNSYRGLPNTILKHVGYLLLCCAFLVGIGFLVGITMLFGNKGGKRAVGAFVTVGALLLMCMLIHLGLEAIWKSSPNPFSQARMDLQLVGSSFSLRALDDQSHFSEHGVFDAWL
jgi:hypothetical protein